MWKQGQHVAIIGSNGSGKTYLESRILPLRAFVVFFRTKSDDIVFKGFKRVRKVTDIELLPRERSKYYLLEPAYRRQSYEGYALVEKVWREHGWCLAFDELFYATQKLGLEREIDRLLTQGRSLGISVVVGMQRPSRISRFALSECIHAFIFRCEGRDIVTVSEAFTPRLKEVIPTLKRYQFAYFNRITGAIIVSDAKHLEGIM